MKGNNIKNYKRIFGKQNKSLGEIRFFGDLIYLPDELRYIKKSDYYKMWVKDNEG